jgi:hypothetical protein
MSLTSAIDLVVCGALLAGLSTLAQYLQPDLPRGILFTGLAGGGLCVLWGILGRRRPGCSVAAMVTLVAVACVVGYQAVQSWQTLAEGESNKRMVAALMTVLVVFCAGMLVNLVKDGKEPQP